MSASLTTTWPSPAAFVLWTLHLDAGADHVPLQVLGPPEKLIPALAELAGPNGLQRE